MDGQYTEAGYILQLKARIPRKRQHLLLGITSVSESWRVLDNFYGNQETVVTSVAERLLAAFPAQDSAHKHYATKPPRATSTREKFAGWALAMREVSNSDRTGVQEGRPTSTFRLKRVTRKEQKAIPRLKKLQHHMVWMKQMKVEEG